MSRISSEYLLQRFIVGRLLRSADSRHNRFHFFPLFQYAPTGAVVRGPAPLPLALAHIETDEKGTIVFTTWSETDFRTEGKPWWT